MTGSVIDRFPTAVRSITESGRGPSVDGHTLRAGDVIRHRAGRVRVVTGTGFGPTNEAVALFDPATGRQADRQGAGRRLDPESWRLLRRALGVQSALGPEERRQVIGYASYDPTSGYRFEWGTTPIGGTFVRLDNGTTPVTDVKAFRSVVRSNAPACLSSEWTTARLDDHAEECGQRRNETDRPLSSLAVDGVEIPTGTDEPVTTGPGRDPFAPGDRFVYWSSGDASPEDPLRADDATLATGRCPVVLGQSSARNSVRCHDVVTDDRLALSPEELLSRRRRARRDGVALELLARGCFVDPLGTGSTVSIHAYAFERGGESGALLAGGHLETTEPRLEHPLSLSVTTFDDPGRMHAALASSDRLTHPLADWARDHPKVGLLRDRLAGRIERVLGDR